MSYIFEANREHESMCREFLAQHGIEKYELIMKGAWDKEEQVHFIQAGPGSRVDGSGSSVMEMTTMDKELLGKRVTFIKLDVEGSEYHSLLGAESLIKEQKPRLAISIYHRAEDFLTLPLLILDMVPEYHLAMRSYATSNSETVLYAWTD